MLRGAIKWLAAMLLGFLLVGCTPGPAGSDRLPGRLYFLSGASLTVLEQGWQRMVTLPRDLTGLAVSPDGRHMTAMRRGRPVLFRVGGDDIVEVAELDARTAVRWSPDSRRLAAMNQGRLRLFDLSGRQLLDLEVASGEQEGVTWSADGRTIAVVVGPMRVTEKHLWLVDIETGSAEDLGKGTFAPLWSPEGRGLVYLRTPEQPGEVWLRMGGEDRALLTQASLGPEFAYLFEKNLLSPFAVQWSPSGDRLLLGFKAAGRDPYFGVIVAPLDGSAPLVRLLPRFPDHPGNAGMNPPRPCGPSGLNWGAGGAQVIFSLRGPGCDGQLHISDADSLSTVRELLIHSSAQIIPAPGGNWIAITGESTDTRLVPLGQPDGQVEVKGLGRLIGWSPVAR